MPRKKNNHPRKLWLQIRVKGRNAPLTIPQNKVIDTLVDSIVRGDYEYPSDWFVEIRWRNKEFDTMKVGEFTAEMEASRLSSSGWDSAVLSYLRGKRR